MNYIEKRALTIINHLCVDGHINNKEQGCLRRAILLHERPQGKWLEHNSYFHKCSKCQKIVGFDYIEQEGEMFNFCPNCGADMRGDDT